MREGVQACDIHYEGNQTSVSLYGQIVRTKSPWPPRRTWRGQYQAPTGEVQAGGSAQILGVTPTVRASRWSLPLLLSNERC